MGRAVVPITDKGDDEKADHRAAGDAQSSTVEEPMFGEPVERQEQREDRGERARHEKEPDADPAPAGNRRELPRRPQPFDGEHREIRCRNEQTQDIFSVHGGNLRLWTIDLHCKITVLSITLHRKISSMARPKKSAARREPLTRERIETTALEIGRA